MRYVWHWLLVYHKHKEIAHTLIVLWFMLEMEIETDATDHSQFMKQPACLPCMFAHSFVRPSLRQR